jgi:ankyrin repeat protein
MPFVAEMLIAHGADPDAARADGRTAYVLAVRTGNTPLAEWFSARGVSTLGVLPVDLFLGACLRADEAAARAQLSAHPDLLATLTEEDRGAIVQAIHENREASVRLMAALGFDLGWEGSWGGTALHHAAWLGRTEMTRVLLALGVPVDARDRQFGSSPIGWAAHGSSHCEGTGADHVAVTALLLDAGSGREASINRWGEPPENLGSRRVNAFLVRWYKEHPAAT